jgi:hypothetical protein
MGLEELIVRGRQEMSKWMERIGGADPALRAEPRPRAALALAALRASAAERFFAGPADPASARLVGHRDPDVRDQIVAAADQTCAGRFDLLGHRGLGFGDPVDWHLDPTSGVRSPRVHWSLVDPLDPSMVGDSKVVWELGRCQWLVTLGQAFQLTGDERYAREFAARVREWIGANPPGIGIHWSSSLEAALRIVSWSWSIALLLRSRAMTPDLFGELLAAVRAHAAHVERYLSFYHSPNTHLTGEALGLFYAGTFLPELTGAARWRALGARILETEIQRQVLEDGVYFEQSTCYQRYTLEIALHFVVLAGRSGRTLPGALREKVGRMLDVVLTLRRPDGTVPAIGDADGGWLLPLARRRPEDFASVFSTAAAVFGREDCAWAAGGRAAPETVWMLGPDAAALVEGLRPAPPRGPTSRVFASGGYVVMRSGWGRHDHQLVFDVGPLGCPVSAGHGHADLLSVQCAAFGEPYVVDPGTGCYASDPGWRDHFRGTAAHSTVTVDGLSQAMPAGPFAWAGRPAARLLRWRSEAAFDFAEGEHDGYGRLPDPVVHRRRVLFLKRGIWILADDLEGAAPHVFEVRFQFAPLDVRLDEAGWARARGRDGRALLVRTFAEAPVERELRAGRRDPLDGWTSPDYGRRTPAPVLVTAGRCRLPVRVLTLLAAVGDADAPPPSVSLLADPGVPGPAGLDFGAGGFVRFGAAGVTVSPELALGLA